MTKFSGSLYGACFLPVLVLGLFVRRRVALAALATMSLGSVCVVGIFVLRATGITRMQDLSGHRIGDSGFPGVDAAGGAGWNPLPVMKPGDRSLLTNFGLPRVLYGWCHGRVWGRTSRTPTPAFYG